MSVNNKFGMSSKKTKKFGKLFKSIDFESNDYYSSNDYMRDAKGRASHRNRPCGEFHIGNEKYNVTIEELRHIEDTARRALESLHRQHTMGIK